MKYNLLGKNSLSLYDILMNRKIQNPQEYINLSENAINDYKLFGLDKLKKAANILLQAVRNNDAAVLVVDSDCDGFCSAAILANYLYKYFPAWVETKLDFFFHDGKAHGLQDCCEGFIAKNYKLILCPDSSSNDYEQHKMLNMAGAKIIILDHHEAPHVSEYENVVTINNQLSDYPNKNFCGAGVTWQFCRFLNDSIFKDNYYWYFIDLAALGNVGDMMSLVDNETAYIIREGIKDENQHNPFIVYISEKNAYSLGSEITPIGWTFYIVPFVNAIVRSGTMEEQKLLFQSFLEYKAFTKVPSNKRGHHGELTNLVEEAVRIAVNVVKPRQTKAQDEGMALLERKIKDENLLQHKVILCLLEQGQISPNLAGLAANKIMAKYQRPVCVLTKKEVTLPPWESANEVDIQYAGSARGCDLVGASWFRKNCEEFDGTIYAQGHESAFGLCLPQDRIKEFLDYTDIVYKDIADEAVYYVDSIVKYSDFLAEERKIASEILEIGSNGKLWGEKVTEPKVVIENIPLTANMVTIYDGRTDTLKINLSPSVTAIKFNISPEEKEVFRNIPPNGSITINLLGMCKINVYNGNVTPQIEIKDFEVMTVKKYDF